MEVPRDVVPTRSSIVQRQTQFLTPFVQSLVTNVPAQVVPMDPVPTSDMPVVTTVSPVITSSKLPTLVPVVASAIPTRHVTSVPTTTVPVPVVTLSPTDRSITPSPVKTQATESPNIPATAMPTAENIFDREDGDEDDPSDNNDTLSGTVSQWMVPIDFTADLQLSNSTTLEEVEDMWDLVLFIYLQSKYRQQPGVEVLMVNLTLLELPQPSRRQRRLQNDDGTTIQIQSTGGADFRIDENQVDDPQAFVDEVDADLDRLITETDFLQQSLGSQENGEPIATVSNVEAIPDDASSENKSGNGKPSTASVVIGFFLLVLTLLSLVFWARVLWRKRQKRLRRRRLAELRKTQTVAILPPASANRDGGGIRISPNKPMQVQHTQSLESMSTYNGYASVSEEEERLTRHADPNEDQYDNDIESEREGNSKALNDEFAKELARAASLDRRAWDEFLLKKKSAQRQKELDISATSPALNGGQSTGSSVGGIAALSNVAVYDAPGSQDMGIEVEARGPTGSFPYGDESSQGANPVPLTSQDAVQWTKDGISLASAYKSAAGVTGIEPEIDDDFEPYGDRKPSRSLQQSWDLEENPVKDERGPSRFSFLYPLKRKNVQETQDRWSPSDDSPTDAAYRESPDVTSVETSTYAVDPTESESKEESLTELTNSMVKEVDDIANYLKQYEEKKVDSKSKQRIAQRARMSGPARTSDVYGSLDSTGNSRRHRGQRLYAASQTNRPSDRHQNPQEHSQSPESRMIFNTSQSSALQPQNILSEQSRSMDLTFSPNNHLSESENSRHRVQQNLPSSNAAVPNRVDTVSAYLSDSSSSGASIDDEESLRLGISRISIEKPTAPNLSFRNNASPPRYSPLPTPYRLSPILPSNDESTLSVVSKSNSVLSALRHSPSILDVVPTGEDKKARSREYNQQGGVTNRGKREPPQPPIEQIATRRRKSITQNETFNNIFSMFEEKPAAPIVPPNETWQYSGSNVGVGTKHQSDAVGRRSSPRFA